MWGSPTGSLPGEVGATDEGFDDPEVDAQGPLPHSQLRTNVQVAAEAKLTVLPCCCTSVRRSLPCLNLKRKS